MKTSIADLRKSYERAALNESDSLADPRLQFEHWLNQAIEGNIDPVTKQIGFVKHGFTLAFHFLAYEYSYKESITRTL